MDESTLNQLAEISSRMRDRIYAINQLEHMLFGLTGDLLKAELCDGTQYCSKDAELFMVPLMEEYRRKYTNLPRYLRDDGGFAAPGLSEACEANGCKYAIRLKENSTLRKLCSMTDDALYVYIVK